MAAILPTPPARQSVKKSISLPVELETAATARARAEQRSLSGYIQSLIARDLRAATQVEEVSK